MFEAWLQWIFEDWLHLPGLCRSHSTLSCSYCPRYTLSFFTHALTGRALSLGASILSWCHCLRDQVSAWSSPNIAANWRVSSWCLEGKVVPGSREMSFSFGESSFIGDNFWWIFCWGIGWLLPLMLGWDSVYPSGKSLIIIPYSPSSFPEPWPENIFISITSHLISSSNEFSPYFLFYKEGLIYL